MRVFVRDNNVDQALRIFEKEDATRGSHSRDETSQSLREAIRAQELVRKQKRSDEHASLREKKPNEKV